MDSEIEEGNGKPLFQEEGESESGRGQKRPRASADSLKKSRVKLKTNANRGGRV